MIYRISNKILGKFYERLIDINGQSEAVYRRTHNTMVKSKNQKTNILCKPRVLASGTQSQFNNLKMKIVLLTRTGLEISVHLIQKVRKKYTLLVQMNLTGTTSTSTKYLKRKTKNKD